MKMIRITVLLLAAVLVLSGCIAAAPVGDSTGTDDGTVRQPVEKEVFPKAPPTLTVVCGEESVTAWRGSYSWHMLLDNGMGTGKHADSMHPLSALDGLPVITVGDGAEVTLIFEIPTEVSLPLTSLTVRRYPTDAEDFDDYETVTAAGTVLTLTADNVLYEVIAAWDVSDGAYSGEAHYAFLTEKE